MQSVNRQNRLGANLRNGRIFLFSRIMIINTNEEEFLWQKSVH